MPRRGRGSKKAVEEEVIEPEPEPEPEEPKVSRDPNLTWSQEQQILGWANRVPVDFLACRWYGHTWTIGLTEVFAIKGDLIREVTCGRCGMRRRDVTPRGEYGYVRRSYQPPPGYTRDADETGTTRTPRWALSEAIVNRSDVLEPTQELVDWYYKIGKPRGANGRYA